MDRQDKIRVLYTAIKDLQDERKVLAARMLLLKARLESVMMDGVDSEDSDQPELPARPKT